MTKKRGILIGVLVLAVVGLFLYQELYPENSQPGGNIQLSGNIELRTVKLAFKVAGRLTELEVEEGEPIAAGQVVARLDQEELEQQRAEVKAALDAARSRLIELQAALEYQQARTEAEIEQRQAEQRRTQAELKKLLAGSRTQEVEEARLSLERAETEYRRAAADWERAEALFRTEDISASQHDQYRAVLQSAEASVRQAREQLTLREEGPRTEDIEAARAQRDGAGAGVRVAEALRLDLKKTRQAIETAQSEIRRAQAQVSLVETRLQDTLLISPSRGTVLVKAAEPGEVLAGGVTVLEIGDLEHPWLRGYIREEDLGRIRLGSAARVMTDSFPDKVYRGRVSFIASEAEFTPKQIQTTSERVRLVYRIKIQLENPNQELKLNMPVDAEILLEQEEETVISHLGLGTPQASGTKHAN